jgi:hypothetical protein
VLLPVGHRAERERQGARGPRAVPPLTFCCLMRDAEAYPYGPKKIRARICFNLALIRNDLILETTSPAARSLIYYANKNQSSDSAYIFKLALNFVLIIKDVDQLFFLSELKARQYEMSTNHVFSSNLSPC